MAILFSKVADQTFKRLQAYNYSVDMYDISGNRVYDPEDARMFFCEPDNIMIYINDNPGDEVLQVNVSSSVNMEEIEDFLIDLRRLTDHHALKFDTQSYNKELTPKDFKAFTVESEEFINSNKGSRINKKGLKMKELQERSSDNMDEKIREIYDNIMFGYAAALDKTIDSIEKEGGSELKEAEKLAKSISTGSFSKVGITSKAQSEIKKFINNIRSNKTGKEHREFITSRIFEIFFNELAKNIPDSEYSNFLFMLLNKISELYSRKADGENVTVPVIISKNHKIGVGSTHGQSWKGFLQSIPGLISSIHSVSTMIVNRLENETVDESTNVLENWFKQFDIDSVSKEKIEENRINRKIGYILERRDEDLRKINEVLKERKLQKEAFYTATEIVENIDRPLKVKSFVRNMNEEQKQRLINCISKYWKDDITEKISGILGLEPKDDDVDEHEPGPAEFRGNAYSKNFHDEFSKDDFIVGLEHAKGIYVANVAEQIIDGTPLNNFDVNTLRTIANYAKGMYPESRFAKSIFDYIKNVKSVAESTKKHVNKEETSINSLNEIYPNGPYHIWYAKRDYMRDASLGYQFLKEEGNLPDPNNLQFTHDYVGSIEASDINDVVYKMQGEVWSPNGEAKDFIMRNGISHTTITTGDVICYNDECYMLDMIGFEYIGDGQTNLTEHVDYENYTNSWEEKGYNITVNEFDNDGDEVPDAWKINVTDQDGNKIVIAEPEEGIYEIVKPTSFIGSSENDFDDFDSVMNFAEKNGYIKRPINEHRNVKKKRKL